MGKKRKADGDLEAEKTLQNSFVTAANSISQLFTLAVQQNKRSRTEGTVDALERTVEWVLKDYGQSEAIPTAVLLQFLQRELAAAEQREHFQSHTAWPAQGAALTPAAPMQQFPGSEPAQPASFGRMQRPSPARPSTPFGNWL